LGWFFLASLLGFTGHLEGCDKSKRFTFLVGFRQKLSQYIVKSLETKGQYSPSFIDVQLFATYLINEKWNVELISNYAKIDSFMPLIHVLQNLVVCKM
jgi:hypothetical protein